MPSPAPAVAPSIARTAPSGTPIIQAVPQSPPPQPRAVPVQVAPPPTEHTVRTAAPPRLGDATAVANGQLASHLGDLGLSAQQIDAVLALSRDVIERVVWEVVPQLAEVMIKQEIARLTKEG